MVWFSVIASVTAYATFLVAGSFVNAQAASVAAAIVVRDELSPGSHHISGMVMVPSPCYQLSVHTDALSSTSYNLTFRTWKDSAVECPPDEVPRQFHEALFAPAAGVDFFATLDGASIPILVLPVVPDPRIPS